MPAMTSSRWSPTAMLLFTLLTVAAPACVQQAPQGREEPATKFEQFLLAKGRVQVREFYNIGNLLGEGGVARFQVARAYTPGKTDYIIALRTEVWEVGGGQRRERIGLLDAEEVASLATALPQMKKMLETLKQSQNPQDTEVEFQGGSLRFGFIVSKGAKARLFVQAGQIGALTAFFETDEFPKLDILISQAAAKIQQLQR